LAVDCIMCVHCAVYEMAQEQMPEWELPR